MRLVVATVVAGALAAGWALGFRPLAVYSGSMEPTLPVGSLMVVQAVPAADVAVGDVITFAHPYAPGALVTHRVVEIVERPEGRAYRTKGDANPARDPWTIALPGDVGRLRADVPYAGWALVYARTREVRSALLAVACLALLLTLLRRIWRLERVESAA